MTDDAPTHSDIHAELERARTQFCELCEHATPADHPRLSNGTRWTSRELVFHMLFGYLITRRLRFVIKAVSRAPEAVHDGFAATLNAATGGFHTINCWGSRCGGRVITPERMTSWCDRTISALHGYPRRRIRRRVGS